MSHKILVIASASLGAGVLIGCSDSRPPYFNEQPTYSDPDLQDRPSYYDARPEYDWHASDKAAAAGGVPSK